MTKAKSRTSVWRLPEPATRQRPKAEPRTLVTARGLVALDTRKLRAQALKAYTKAARAFEKDDQVLTDFEQGDIPAFERWKHQQLGPLLAEIQQLDQELREAVMLHDIAMDESWRTGLPPWKALQQWHEAEARRRNRAEPAPSPLADDFGDLPTDDDPDFNEKMRAFLKNSSLGKLAESFGIDFDDMPSEPPPDEGPRKGQRSAGPVPRPELNASIRTLYRQLCRLLHPDTAGEMTPARREVWYQVQEAYEAGDAARLDTLLARVEQSAGVEIRPRTVAEILGMKQHYERARRQLRAVLRSARSHPAWEFVKRDERTRTQLEQDIRRDLTQAISSVRHQLDSLRKRIQPPPARAPKPRT